MNHLVSRVKSPTWCWGYFFVVTFEITDWIAAFFHPVYALIIQTLALRACGTVELYLHVYTLRMVVR